jgi:hypothetical protein
MDDRSKGRGDGQQRGCVIVIFDDPTDAARGGPRFRRPDCDDVAERHFESKRSNGWSTGADHWAPSEQGALLLSRPCGHCGGGRA